jgi:UDPglucose--hexose-1-phosphate uridylyltransferase
MSDSEPPQIRTDVITGRRVVVASGRGGRPKASTPDPMLTCENDPFLAGNESATPSESFAIRDGQSAVDQPGWTLRVVPNRYPLASDPHSETPIPVSTQLFPAIRSDGIHDVVIECPDNRSRLLDLSVEELHGVLVAWQTRIRAIASQHSVSDIVVFRNEGFSAGASLPHCHSQIVGYCNQTPGMNARRAAVVAYRHSTGRDLTSDWSQAEITDGRRVVTRDAEFGVFCPFAPRTNYHMRIVPLDSVPQPFHEVSPSILFKLAETFNDCLQRLDSVLANSSFNVLLPVTVPEHPVDFRWMLELVPRTTRPAGWELLTDVDVVTVRPEQAAAELRRGVSQV